MADQQQQQQEELATNGTFIAGHLEILCLGCAERGEATVIPIEVVNSEPENPEMVDDFFAPCPRCTQVNGKRTGVVVNVLAGAQVEQVFGDEGADGAGGA